MKLIFFDEAKNDDDYPHYHIGGVCIDEADLAEVEARLNAVAKSAFGSSELVRVTELHAAEIYHRKKHFKEWRDLEARINLLDQMMQILTLPKVLFPRLGPAPL